MTAYDPLGRLKTNRRNGNALLKTEYAYNVRSWTKSISGQLFSETLYYNDRRPDGSGTPRYCGDISAIDWNAGGKPRGYDLAHDNLSRLTGAEYMENGSRSGRYSASYSYDSHGNVTALRRGGLRDDGEYGDIDNLEYTYDGNQLKKVTDGVSGPCYKDAFHFVDGADADIEYEYDQNGNMTKDLNKGMTNISYNLLNLPMEVSHSDGSMEKYVYGADGRKQRVTYSVQATGIVSPMTRIMRKSSSPGNGMSTVQTIDYCGNVIYDNNMLSSIQVAGGYITLNGTAPVYHYYITDHEGNNRVVADAVGGVEQVNHYYPFGALFGDCSGSGTQRYKYNGKELDRMHGLDWYDYGARNYDAAVPMWTSVDPLCEKYYYVSPYVYCGNDPIKFVDKDGLDFGDFFLTPDGAARDFGMIYNYWSISTNKEYNSTIYSFKDNDGKTKYSYNKPLVGGESSSVPNNVIPKGATLYGSVHSHAAYDEDNEFFAHDGNHFSKEDIDGYNKSNIKGGYVCTPNGTLMKYNKKKDGKHELLTFRGSFYKLPSDLYDPTNNGNTIEKIDKAWDKQGLFEIVFGEGKNKYLQNRDYLK